MSIPTSFTLADIRVTRAILIVLLAFVPLRAFSGPPETRVVFGHPLNSAPQQIRPRIGAQVFPETTHVLAVMTDFVQDKDDRTTGTGSFDLSAATNVIDPTPHNKAYFDQHAAFLQNYFRKSSDGRCIVEVTVLDSVYHLSHKMRYYSPSPKSPDNREIGLMMQETWHLVDSLNPGFPFRQYDVFLIFHAGAGRDIDFVSIYGYDPTPFDIPSIYVGPAALKKMFGSAYDGISVGNGLDTIRNSLIIPETESRPLSGGAGTSLLQLGINGLLAATFGSSLGLPDLFDTKSGASGIGRFGLMDGQSIFSWSGIFPPQPSAWERYFLGWSTPITVSAFDSVYTFPASSLPGAEDSLFRVPISAREYFLVENRCRDAHGDGAIITLVRDGSTITKTYPRDFDPGFNFSSQDSLYGVVTDVDEFDWSLPGFSPTGSEMANGGLLIWHIDENVIDASIETDAVNANPIDRGVNLLEADGSQDIGQTYDLLSPGFGSENGTSIDFWYGDNSAPARRISNVFSPTSLPSSRSNNQANTHIVISGFSLRGPYMTARIQLGDNVVSPIPGFPKYTGMKFGRNSVTIINDKPTPDSTSLVVATDVVGVQLPATPTGLPISSVGESKLYGWHIAGGTPLLTTGSADGLLVTSGNASRAFVGKPVEGNLAQNGTADLAIGMVDNAVFLPPATPLQSANTGWGLQDLNSDGKADSLFATKTFRRITTSPVLSDSFVVYGAEHGTVYIFRYDGTLSDSVTSSQDTSGVVGICLEPNPAGTFVAVTINGSFIQSPGRGCVRTTITAGSPFRSALQQGLSPAVLGRTPPYNLRTVMVSPAGMVYDFNECLGIEMGFPVSTDGTISNAPAIADIDGDGSPDIIVASGKKIYAINNAGAVLDNFPVTLPTYQNILSSPIVADVEGNGSVDIVAVTQEGLVVAYNRFGKMINGFPLQGGINGGSTPAAFLFRSTQCQGCEAAIGIAVASDDGNVYAWQTGTVASLATPVKMPWPQYLHDAQNSSIGDPVSGGSLPASDFFPASRAYNWPNPVGKEQAFKTHIRYYVGTDAQVHIKIYDLAGEMVTQFDGPGTGGRDNEVEWDVSGIQSGVYFAHIDAQGSGGTGNAIIKIAVVK
ncbi:MAG TPA: FG-GAP-like repeat-containing protein [Bacteroidota bacterium]|nr:FG-GAP-like repeat-containing protein [Bacteroidota bacterium]